MKVGFNIDEQKTEYMIVIRTNGNRVPEVVIEVDGYRFKRVDRFG